MRSLRLIRPLLLAGSRTPQGDPAVIDGGAGLLQAIGCHELHQIVIGLPALNLLANLLVGTIAKGFDDVLTSWPPGDQEMNISRKLSLQLIMRQISRHADLKE